MIENTRAVEDVDGGDVADVTDSELIELVRGGQTDAFAVLFDRHRFAADRLARHLAPTSDADDIVAEAFAQVFNQLAQGRGPDTAFRAYLLTSVRHEAGRRGKARQRVRSTDDLQQIDAVEDFVDLPALEFENSTVRQAFSALPERWQLVLWHVDVQGKKPHELTEMLGLSANGVSALAYRARAGLSDAYVQAHVNQATPTVNVECAAARERLAAFASQNLARRDTRRVAEHLESCSSCLKVLMDIKDVSSRVHRGVSDTGAQPAAARRSPSVTPAAAAPVAAAADDETAVLVATRATPAATGTQLADPAPMLRVAPAARGVVRTRRIDSPADAPGGPRSVVRAAGDVRHANSFAKFNKTS